MDKAALLASLAAKSWVDHVYDEHLDNEDDGFNYYSVRIRELRGSVGAHRQVKFYVVDDGGAGEVALWQGVEPTPHHNTSEFRKWMFDAYVTNPLNFPGLILHYVDEVGEWAYISYIVSDAQAQFWVRKGQSPVATTFDYDSFKYTERIDGA